MSLSAKQEQLNSVSFQALNLAPAFSSIRAAGVETMWRDDAQQEINIARWQHREAKPYYVAVAFNRKLTHYRRMGGPVVTQRAEGMIGAATPDFSHVSDALMDVQRALGRLPERYRRLLLRVAAGEQLRCNADWQALFQARRKLREICA